MASGASRPSSPPASRTSARRPPISDSRSDGNRPNSDWQERGGSLRLEWRPSDAVRVGLEGALRESEVGVPGPVGGESPRARQEDREERLQLPIQFRPARGHDASVLFARVASERRYANPDFDFASEIDVPRRCRRAFPIRFGPAGTS